MAERGYTAEEEKAPIPDFWTEFLPYVWIESDERAHRGPIKFDPWDFQKDRLEQFQSGRNVVWLKRRQIGASWLAVIHAYYMAAYHPGFHVAFISQGQPYADEMMRKLRYVAGRLPIDLQRKYHGGVQRMEFQQSGSMIVAFPSTETAALSFSFGLIVTDEGAMHPYAAENFGAYSPAIDAGGQHLVMSTANPNLGQSGWFYEFWNSAVAGDMNYLPVFDGRWCRPDQTEEWFEETKPKYVGIPHALDAFYPETPSEAFVGRSGLALPGFDATRNVRESDPMEWEDYDWRIAAIDPGGGDPTAISVYGVWRDRQTGEIRFHQPMGGEFYSREPVALDEMISYLAKWLPLDRAWIDTAGGTVLLNSLKRYGFPANKALKDRTVGLQLYNQVLEEGRLTHHVSCEEAIKEYPLYRLVEKRDPYDKQRYRTSTPIDNHADAKDATRYALVGFKEELERGVAARAGSDLRLVWDRGA